MASRDLRDAVDVALDRRYPGTSAQPARCALPLNALDDPVARAQAIAALDAAEPDVPTDLFPDYIVPDEFVGEVPVLRDAVALGCAETEGGTGVGTEVEGGGR
jgi:hypothetical protein